MKLNRFSAEPWNKVDRMSSKFFFLKKKVGKTSKVNVKRNIIKGPQSRNQRSQPRNQRLTAPEPALTAPEPALTAPEPALTAPEPEAHITKTRSSQHQILLHLSNLHLPFHHEMLHTPT